MMIPDLVYASLISLCVVALGASADAFLAPSPSASASSCLAASGPQHQLPVEVTRTPVPPPPPMSVPVWSLSCPVPFAVGRSSSPPSSSMSIVTFATPVSVSSPKLWAISLCKTSLTRCAFLGVPASGAEYNDIPSISSSATATPGVANYVRRRDAMGEAGVLGSVEGAAGWRTRGTSGPGGLTSGGVAVLQLMAPGQSKLVPVLGKTTGWDVGQVDKRAECAGLGNEWVTVAGSNGEMTFEVLPNCASYLQVKLKRVTDGGDHDVAICEVVGTGIWDVSKRSVVWLSESDAGNQSALGPTSALYTGQLRDEGII